jgi:hypothetical protein
MTEIDVVKKSSRVWLWIVMAILVLAALFFMTRGGSDNTRTGHLIDHRGQPSMVVALVMQG